MHLLVYITSVHKELFLCQTWTFLEKKGDHGPEEHPILNSAEATPIMDELDVGEDGRKG